MPENLQAAIQRILSGSFDEADMRAIAQAIQIGQVVLAVGDRAIAIGGNVSNSVILTGDNNQVIRLTEEAANLLERILQQWQPRPNRYVQPQGCQNLQACDRYLASVLKQLEQLGNPEIQKDVIHNGRRFNYVARIIDFEPGLGMRGEAFFMFSEFAFLNLDTLQRFSTQSALWAREQVHPSATGQAFYNFRVPNHCCFAIALVDQLDDATLTAIRTTNPLGQRVDLLWYEVPVVYELNRQQLYYYDRASNFWEHFRSEIIWHRLRAVIQQVLMSSPKR